MRESMSRIVNPAFLRVAEGLDRAGVLVLNAHHQLISNVRHIEPATARRDRLRTTTTLPTA